MKKILMTIAAALSGIYAWWCGVTLQDVIDTLYHCVNMISAVVSAFIDYIMPRQEGIRAYFTSSYLATRSFMGKIFGWQPLSIYDFIVDRAKANPLEAVGAVAVILAILWLIKFKYRTLYRFYHWLLVTRRKRH
jgi:hypothetical protein